MNDELNFNPDVYHLNEAPWSQCSFFHLNEKNLASKEEVTKRVVFSNSTPKKQETKKPISFFASRNGYFKWLFDPDVKKTNRNAWGSFSTQLGSPYDFAR